MSDVDPPRARTVPAAGSLGEAVNVLFDRAEDMLHTWIGKKWAYVVSLLAALLVFLVAWPSISEMRDAAATPLEQIQWVGTLMMTLIVVIMLQNQLANMVYSFMMITANKQHIANTHWLGEYAKAVRASGSLLLPTTV